VDARARGVGSLAFGQSGARAARRMLGPVTSARGSRRGGLWAYPTRLEPGSGPFWVTRCDAADSASDVVNPGRRGVPVALRLEPSGAWRMVRDGGQRARRAFPPPSLRPTPSRPGQGGTGGDAP
jgi:hypothetical protein